jgi:uncharacterized membrane protein (UPF0127 family)
MNTAGLRTAPALQAAMFLFLVLFSCNAREKVKFETRDLVIASSLGEIAINAEIARSDLQREQGLMFRKSLDDGKGMLFIFERDQIMSFWMKNTLIPLSIAFIASDGRILEIHDMESQNLDPVKSSRSARYALEVPRGWFGRAGIKSGDRLVTLSF